MREESMAARIVKTCPACGRTEECWRNPVPTVDIIIEVEGGIVLIRRKNPPPGWALPGGFVDYGESLEEAAVREAREETGLEVTLIRQFHTYSRPDRDPRQHTISTVFVARAAGALRAGDDAAGIGIFTRSSLPPLAFDHGEILADYFQSGEEEFRRRNPGSGSGPC
jgi:ADP-ribose pyrophosphatase YjhB (NUDIX family)